VTYFLCVITTLAARLSLVVFHACVWLGGEAGMWCVRAAHLSEQRQLLPRHQPLRLHRRELLTKVPAHNTRLIRMVMAMTVVMMMFD
jgi:hypothetical protein